MAANAMSRDVLLAIKSTFEKKGVDEALKAIGALSSLDKKTFFSTIGESLSKGLRNATGEVFRLLNPLNLIPKTLGVITGGFGLLGKIATTALGVAVGTALSTVTRSLAELAQSPVEVAARVEVLENGLRTMAATAGKSIEFVEGKVETLKKAGITTREAIESITQFLSNQLPIDNIEDLARAAQDMAVVFGKNSSETFNRFVTTILTGNSELLRAVGIAKTSQQMFTEYGKTINKTAGELTTLEQRQAILNGIMQSAAPYAGQYERALDNVGKKLTSLPRYIEEAQLAIGRGFVPILNASVDILSEVIKGVGSFFEENRSTFEGFGDAVADGLRTGWERAKGFLGEISRSLVPDFDPQTWFQGGVDLVVNLADGLLTGLSDYVIPAVVSIADTVASFLLAASPPKRGPLRKIIQGAIDLMELYMQSFGEADYGILDEVLGPIEQRLRSVGVMKGDEAGAMANIAQARAQVAEIIKVFGETGVIPTEKLAELSDLIGETGDKYARLLELHLQFKAASERVAELEGQVAQAKEAGFVPTALKEELATAEKQRDEIGQRIRLAELELQQRQRNLDLMSQLGRLMERMAKQVEQVAAAQRQVAKTTQDSSDVASQLAQAVGELPKKIDEAREKWRETFTEMFASFSRLETPLSKLGDFVKGFIGFYSPEEQAAMRQFGDDVSAGYKAGEKARETFNLLVEGIKTLPGKVGEFVTKLGEIQTWFEGLPPWVQDVLKGVALAIVLNFATGGAVGSILQGLIVGAFAAAGLTVALEAGVLAAVLAISIKPFLSEEVREDWKQALRDLTTLEHDPVASIGKAAETTLEHTPIMSELLNWVDSLFAKKPEIEQKARETMRDPLITAAEEAQDALVGRSIIPEMVTNILNWLTRMKLGAVSILTFLKITAIQLFTQMTATMLQLIAEMVKNVLEELVELRDKSEEILEETAEIFERMAERIAEAMADIKDEIKELLKELDELIKKAKEAEAAMQDAGLLPGSPPALEVGLRSIADAMRVLPGLTAQWSRAVNVSPMPAMVPVVAGAGGGQVINNHFYEGAFAGAFPSVRTARDAGGVMDEFQRIIEGATAKANIPGGVR